MAAPSPTAPATVAANSSIALAVSNGTLGVGFTGSGFLIFYFTGVVAILQHLGVITNTTRLAGASGGAITALQVCSNTPFGAQAFQDNLMLATMCRPQKNCQGFLDKALSEVLEAKVSEIVSDCSGRLWVSITAAKPANQSDDNVLVGGQWVNKSQAVAAVRLSSYLPGVSGASATLRLPEMESRVGASYDGGFSQSLPCPPGVSSCIRVSPFPYSPVTSANAGSLALLNFNSLASGTTAAAADPSTGPYLPLNPTVIPEPKPDIYPGLSKPLPVNATVWQSYGLNVADNATLKSMYDIGREDAAFWALELGVASPTECTQALQATQLT